MPATPTLSRTALPLATPPVPVSLPRWLGLAWLLCLALALAWDASGLDLAVMRGLGGPGGFPLAHQWLLQTLLHQGVQRLATVVFVAMWLTVVWPRGPFRAWPRSQRLAVAVTVTLALATVSGLKQLSLTSCPSALIEFGGPAAHVSHWAWGVSDGGTGHCFPGGHVSSAFGFMALAFPWLARRDARSQRLGAGVLGGIGLFGLVLGLSQTLRGAHFPSHTLWSLWLCASVSGAGWQACHWLTRGRPPHPG